MGGDPTYEYLMEIKGCMLEGGRDGGKERGGSGWRRRLGEMMGIEVGTEGAPWHAAIKEEGEEGDGEEGGQGEEAGSSGDSNPVSVTPIPSSSSSSSSTSSSSSSSIATAMDSKGREDKEEEENGKYRRISQEGDPRVTLESFLSCPKVYIYVPPSLPPPLSPSLSLSCPFFPPSVPPSLPPSLPRSRMICRNTSDARVPGYPGRWKR